ncbi:DUF4190 domain-containing protein [Streptomyces sp. NP160]|uniref:DUF4190 domain-containing protein n=1 Tax=Streptomyces sp. NP160 TaxID=2586637 RepID=UPI001C588CC0|nr:DUF4190 domain-containing protein [Streptomyces sp. NP160]
MSQQPTQYGYGTAPVQRPTETMAILAIVFAFVFSPLGIVFGIIGRKNIDRNGNSGRGLATAGMWLGIVFTALGVLYVVGLIVLISVAATSGSTAP